MHISLIVSSNEILRVIRDKELFGGEIKCCFDEHSYNIIIS